MNKSFLKMMCLSDKFIVKHGRKSGYIGIICGILIVIASGILYLWFNSMLQDISRDLQLKVETLQDIHRTMSSDEEYVEHVIGLLTITVKFMFVFLKPFCIIIICSGMLTAYNGLMYLRLKELAEKASNKMSDQSDILPSP